MSKIETKCSNCGNIFTGEPNRKYCSRQCASIVNHAKRSQIVARTIICKTCGKEFQSIKSSKRKFCSLSCSSKYHNQGRKGFRDVVLTCSYCGDTFTKLKCEYDKHNNKGLDRHFCSKKCAGKSFIGEERNNTTKSLLKWRKTSSAKTIKYRAGWYRNDLDCYFRSSWEANYARIMNYLGISWQYEPETFPMCIDGQETSYLPDFFIPEENKYVEVKGYWRNDLSKKKYENFSKCHNIELVDPPIYNDLKKRYSDLVLWEGGRKHE